MNFQLSEEQLLLIDGFQKFLEREVKPLARRYRDQLIPVAEMRTIQQAMTDFGVGAGVIEEEFGGMGVDAVTSGLLQFELSRMSPDIAVTSLIQNIVGKLMRYVPDQLRSSYLADVLAVNRFGCVGMSEPDAGSQVTAVRCRAVEDGDDYVINGEKLWISNGGYSDFIFLLARFNNDPVGGLGLILVERQDGYETCDIEKMGLNSQSTAQVSFQDVRVPKTNLMVPPGEAMKTLLISLSGSRPLVSLMALGVAQASLDESVSYAQDRTQFGKPIAGHQLISAKIGEMATKVEAGKLLALKALSQIDRGERSDLCAAMSKWFGTQMACEVVSEALQIHGGNGITKEYPVEYMYRAVRPFMVTEGTNEIQKLSIGRALTGIDAFG
ncbi:acyl-CoA dehydrogenase, short-chain specific [marine gamma proteobacterium HTCC2080]|jgi:alkylation response protein AidB-like acyl-CoA dehydrogenase|nr:acyl-CoA dehydrogenase, short-chain specific [marine gamma proteobacterium HTCC2080]